MNVEFDKSFQKALKKISQVSVFPKIEALIEECENANSLQGIKNIKKLTGFTQFLPCSYW